MGKKKRKQDENNYIGGCHFIGGNFGLCMNAAALQSNDGFCGAHSRDFHQPMEFKIQTGTEGTYNETEITPENPLDISLQSITNLMKYYINESSIDSQIDEITQFPIIGLVYMIEVKKEEITKYFICNLCSREISPKDAILHIKSLPHIINYIKRYRLVLNYDIDEPEGKENCLRQLIQHEQEVGRGGVMVCPIDDLPVVKTFSFSFDYIRKLNKYSARLPNVDVKAVYDSNLNKVIVKNISKGSTLLDVVNSLEVFGKITNINLIGDGTAIVGFSTQKEANNLLQYGRGTLINDQTIQVLAYDPKNVNLLFRNSIAVNNTPEDLVIKDVIDMFLLGGMVVGVDIIPDQKCVVIHYYKPDDVQNSKQLLQGCRWLHKEFGETNFIPFAIKDLKNYGTSPADPYCLNPAHYEIKMYLTGQTNLNWKNTISFLDFIVFHEHHAYKVIDETNARIWFKKKSTADSFYNHFNGITMKKRGTSRNIIQAVRIPFTDFPEMKSAPTNTLMISKISDELSDKFMYNLIQRLGKAKHFFWFTTERICIISFEQQISSVLAKEAILASDNSLAQSTIEYIKNFNPSNKLRISTTKEFLRSTEFKRLFEKFGKIDKFFEISRYEAELQYSLQTSAILARETLSKANEYPKMKIKYFYLKKDIENPFIFMDSDNIANVDMEIDN